MALIGPFSELREPILKSLGFLKSPDPEVFKFYFFWDNADVDILPSAGIDTHK